MNRKNTAATDNLYLNEQECKKPWLFFENRRVPRAEKI